VRLDWHCVAFTRTVGWEARDTQVDRLTDYDGLVRWSLERGLLSREDAEAVGAEAREKPEQALAALEDARTLRLVLYRVLSAVGVGGTAEPTGLEELNAYLRRYVPCRRLVESGSGIGWTWDLDPSRLDDLLGPVVWSAAELLTSPEAARLRLCAADDCGWLFIDGSRNRSRRWCDMSDCGNRAKVRRFRRRQREAGG